MSLLGEVIAANQEPAAALIIPFCYFARGAYPVYDFTVVAHKINHLNGNIS